MKVAILTTQNQWFVSYAQKLQEQISAEMFFTHEEIEGCYDIVFILSYHRIIPERFLSRHKHNIVVHASDLPCGKGWAPLFWQVLEGKNNIVFSMFEAGSGVDDGDIYMQKTMHLTGYELNASLRRKQAEFTLAMCMDFLANYERLKKPVKQVGEETFYEKRTPKDSELDIDKSIKEQINLLRIVSNEEYPAFFMLDGHKYILKIEEEDANS